MRDPAARLSTLIVLPASVGAATPLGLGVTATLLLFGVQRAWGVVPIYLNELSPPPLRATLANFVYQAWNFLAAGNANIQIWLTARLGGDYALTTGPTVAVVALAIIVLIMAPPGTDRTIQIYGISTRTSS
jgi:SHS family lactate transporter-like MFS transporter